MTTSSDFSDPEDNIIELTQNNTEQRTELISNSYIQNSPGTIRCYLCSLDITQLSIFEREVHVNSCLDKPSIPIEFHCPSCGRDLTHFNEHRRTAHVNLCLDRSITTDHAFEIENIPPRQSHYEETKPRENEPDDNVEAESEEYLCKICGINLSDQQLIMRIRHVKRCGKQFGIRPQEIQHEIQLHDAKHNDLVNKSSNAFSVMMSATTPTTKSNGIKSANSASAVNAFEILMRNSRTRSILDDHSLLNASFKTNRKRFRFQKHNSFGSYNPSCPAFKTIKGTSPPFVVDGFKYCRKDLTDIYFLTHFHSDHYVGLDKRFDCGIIYCNEITAKLVKKELNVDSKYIHPVSMNSSFMVRDVQITFIDANHCPGAAIILFVLKNGQTYLHTGDFRYQPEMLSHPALKMYVSQSSNKCSSVRRLDGIYLDTTYAEPKYSFPPQSYAVEQVLKIMEEQLRIDKTLYLFGSYAIGKERLFMEVARVFNKKIVVSKSKLDLISCFNWPKKDMAFLTIESIASDIHVVPMQQINMEMLNILLVKHRLRYRRIVAFRPTGFSFSTKARVSVHNNSDGNIKIYGVPYSEHSSFTELCEFLSATNPREIIPTVNCYNEKNVKKQIENLRSSAFHNIRTMMSDRSLFFKNS